MYPMGKVIVLKKNYIESLEYGMRIEKEWKDVGETGSREESKS